MDGVTDDVPHNTDSDGYPNVFKLERNDDGLWLNDNWAKPDNEWNPDNKFVFRLRNSFLSRGLHVAVFLFGIAEIFLPTAEHLSRFLQLQRNVFAVLVGNKLAFPCDRNEEFECVQNQDAVGYLFRFLLLFGKISDIRKLEQIEKFIYHNIISTENLLAAWREFLRNKRGRKDIERFSLHLTDNILALHRELFDKTYQHGPYKAFRINDPKPRDIHKATVRDRLLHHAIYRILYPYFDPKFIFDSYSCRRVKGTHRAINRFRDDARKVSRNHTRTVWVLKCDIRKFFANINHQILGNILKKHIKSGNTILLLSKVVRSFHTKDRPDIGLPLGNLTSQLLVNIYMNELDHFLKREMKVAHCVRYADDFVILHESKEYLENLLPKLSEFLETRLKLSLHTDKVFIKTWASGVDFLGWVHFPHHRIPRTSTKKRMFRNLRQKQAESSVASYLGLLSHGNTHDLRERVKEEFPPEE